jgi:hypothetical protein
MNTIGAAHESGADDNKGELGISDLIAEPTPELLEIMTRHSEQIEQAFTKKAFC